MTAVPVVDISIREGIAYLGIEDPGLWEQIIEATSFKDASAEYRTRDRRRDKRVKLVRNGKAPIGLLDRVCRVISTYGHEIRVTQETNPRVKPRVATRIFDVEPRDYQLEASAAVLFNDRGIIRIPTGGGKTLIACEIIATHGLYTVVIVPTIDLLIQTRDYLAAHLTRDVGFWKIGQLGNGVVDPQPVTVATIRTIAKVLNVAYETYEFAEYDDSDNTEINRQELRDWVEALGLVIVDEAHQLGAKVLYETVTKIPALRKYGMSASPWRDDGADLMIEAATGPAFLHVPAERLVREGYLMAPHFRVIDTSKWWTAAAWGSVCTRCSRQWLYWVKECSCGNRNFRSQFPDSYRNEIVENPTRNTHVAQIVGELVATGRTVLVLVKQVKHGRLLAELIPNAIFLSGRNKGEDRHAVLDAVRAGLQRVLICTAIADMGLDIPSLGALVLAGGGKSSTRHLQRIGRVVRPAPGKQQPIVVDLDDSHIHSWYASHIAERRKIEKAEWEHSGATWSQE